MAEPNPDDGLVPEISELYKRSPAEWQREARRRTKLEATVEKLEQMESSLDGETTTKSDAKDETIVGECAKSEEEGRKTSDSKSNESSKTVSKEARTLEEAENVENGRNFKRSKLSSKR